MYMFGNDYITISNGKPSDRLALFSQLRKDD